MEKMNNNITQLCADYDTLEKMIKKDKIVRVSFVSKAIRDLISDSEDAYSGYDEDDDTLYETSVYYKMKSLAAFIATEEYLVQGTSDDFHNLAVDYSRQNMYIEACEVLERGIEQRNSSVDLLADYILYGRNVPGRRAKCREYYEKLCRLPKSKWNWRAYSFSIEHLLEERDYVATSEEEETIRKAIISTAKEYVKRYDNGRSIELVDRAYSDLADAYAAFGNMKKQYETLKLCVEKYDRAPISASKLGRIEFENGNYRVAADYLSKCLSVLEVQPSVGQGYVYLIRAYNNTSLYLSNKDHIASNNQSAELSRLLKSINRDIDTVETLGINSTYSKAIDFIRCIIETQCDDEMYE